MSRVGKKTIVVPDGVTVTVDNNVSTITAKGPKGSLSMAFKPFINVNIEESSINFSIADENDRVQKAIWGTTRAIVSNLVEGVSAGFKKEVELNGVGFRMELGTDLILHIGFSHPVVVKIPPAIKLTLNKNVLSGESIDKHILGDFFTTIHDMKPCDVYKQKGFKFPGRVYRKKVGKKAK